eukprot:TRINITY_DN1624_c0_g5_i1.p1 TRINITY_DN1624_c0_g5~~TRINITY_DN1624_c0_g5_i1.p1  ORF type:complete len:268 (+),score=62.83 TRINITY_DN1624_c0_g5_i1:666-1469(+)
MHRDIKPDNFLIGVGPNEHIIYIIDFGLTKHYCNPKNGMHIPYKDNKSLTGTARYASLNTHNGVEQSRRDDLECLGYILVYFMKGSLPWQGLQAKDRKEKYEKIKGKKASIGLEKLCEGLPNEFAGYIKYCRSLKFDEAPNYVYVKKLFEDRFNDEKYTMDYQFDWVTLKSLKKESDNEAIKLMLKRAADTRDDEKSNLLLKVEEQTPANKVPAQETQAHLLTSQETPKEKSKAELSGLNGQAYEYSFCLYRSEYTKFDKHKAKEYD